MQLHLIPCSFETLATDLNIASLWSPRASKTNRPIQLFQPCNALTQVFLFTA